MKPLAPAVAVVLSLAMPATADEATIKAHCAAKWSVDFEMQAFCVKNQTEAFNAIQLVHAAEHDETLFGKAVGHCESRWTTDFEMQAFCMESQFLAIHAIAKAQYGLPTDVLEPARDLCIQRWQPDFEMIDFCITEQAEGWKGLQD